MKLFLLMILPLAFIDICSADIFMNIQQNGPDVVVTSEGSVDLSDFFFVTEQNTGGFVRPVEDDNFGAQLLTGTPFTGTDMDPLADGYILDFDLPITGDFSFGSGPLVSTVPTFGAGDVHGFLLPHSFQLNSFVLLVPQGYQSGDFLQAEMTFINMTLTELGLEAGSFQFTAGSNTFNIDVSDLSDVNELIVYGDMDVLGAGTYTFSPTAAATLFGLDVDEITFSSEVNHTFPFSPEADDFPGTDQIFTSSTQSAFGDGYSSFAERQAGPQVLHLDYSSLVDPSVQIDTFTLGIAADDFQFPLFGQSFTASINGTPNQRLTDALNGLDQTGPQVQFFTIGLDVETLTPNNQLVLSIDQAGDGRDGWAIDFLTIGISTSSLPELGDVNLDGAVSFADIPAFIDVLLSGEFQAEADCDESGVVDFSDIPAFIQILLAS